MAKLPGASDLGEAPAIGPRPVASIDVSGLARGGAALAAGAERLGQGISQAGRDVGEVAQKWNEEKTFDAHAGAASELLNLHSDLQKSKDYGTLDQQYKDRSKEIVDKWAETVPNGALRRHFEASQGEAVARGAASVSEMAFKGLGQTDADSRKAALADIEAKIGEDPTNAFLPDAMRGLGLRVDSAVSAGWETKERGDLEKRDAAVKIAIRSNETDYQQNPLAWLQSKGIEPRQSKAQLLAGINRAATDNGISPDAAARVIQIESGGNPNARTGSYYGLTQISQSEFAKYNKTPGADIFDPDANMRAGFAKMRAEGDQFANATGRQPSDFDRYMIHQQGLAGYQAHLANPNAPAWQNMLSTGEGQQKGERWAKAAVWGNIPDEFKRRVGNVDNVTSGDFLNMWSAKYGGTPRDFNDTGAEPVHGDETGWNNVDPITRMRMVTQAKSLAQQRAADTVAKNNAVTNERVQDYERIMIDANAGIGVMPPRELIEKDPMLAANGNEAHRNTLLRLHDAAVEHANRPEARQRISDDTTANLVDRMRKPEGDPLKLTDRNEITDAFVKKQMTRGDYDWALKQFDDLRSGGDSWAKDKAKFLTEVVKPQVTRADIAGGIGNTKAGASVLEFDRMLERKKEAMIKDGKNPLDLVTPGTKDYMGSDEIMKPWRRTAAKDMAALAAEDDEAAANKPQPTPPASAAINPESAKTFAELQGWVKQYPLLRERALDVAKQRGMQGLPGWPRITQKARPAVTDAPTIPMSQ